MHCVYLKFTQTGTFAWGIFIAMTVTSESKYRILSLVSQRYTYMSLHCIYFIISCTRHLYNGVTGEEKVCISVQTNQDMKSWQGGFKMSDTARKTPERHYIYVSPGELSDYWHRIFLWRGLCLSLYLVFLTSC